jgi:hypothetical protein
MIKGTLKSGFDFEISEAVFDDFELIELYAAVNKNPIYLGALAEKLLGKDQKKALVEHLRGEDGIVHTTDMMNALSEIEEAIPAAKN